MEACVRRCTAESGILYVKLNWKDEAEQPILADLQRAFDIIGQSRTDR